MTSRDIFRIIVATLGLLGVAYGALYFLDGLLYALGLLESSHVSPKFYAAHGAVEIVLGLMIMRGVPPLVDFAFPLKDDSEDDTPKDG